MMAVPTSCELTYFMPELEESCDNFAPRNPTIRRMKIAVIDVLIPFIRIATRNFVNSKLFFQQSLQCGYSGSSFLTILLW